MVGTQLDRALARLEMLDARSEADTYGREFSRARRRGRTGDLPELAEADAAALARYADAADRL